jgi:hypothetical protein
MFPALHELLVNDFAGIVFPSLDMNSLLHDGVCSTSKGFASAILPWVKFRSGVPRGLIDCN